MTAKKYKVISPKVTLTSVAKSVGEKLLDNKKLVFLQDQSSTLLHEIMKLKHEVMKAMKAEQELERMKHLINYQRYHLVSKMDKLQYSLKQMNYQFNNELNSLEQLLKKKNKKSPIEYLRLCSNKINILIQRLTSMINDTCVQLLKERLRLCLPMLETLEQHAIDREKDRREWEIQTRNNSEYFRSEFIC